jgi:hypothetical protein
VQAVLRQHWGLSGELCPLYTSAASRTWQVGGYVVKLARDEPSHFTAGLLASEAVERAGTKTGAPIRTIAGELCVPLPVGRRSRVVAVLHKIDSLACRCARFHLRIWASSSAGCTASCAAARRPARGRLMKYWATYGQASWTRIRHRSGR